MFDKERFSALLIKARGDRTNEDFSKESGVSRAYISKYINKRLDRSPSPDIIRRLADYAQGDVAYEDLMIASGHLSVESKVKENTGTYAKDVSNKEEFTNELIQILIETGELKPNEHLTEEKRKRLYKIIKKAIELSKM
ncbi:helix-turn-helix domain-containing protein [Wukongibacter baidiensis]